MSEINKLTPENHIRNTTYIIILIGACVMLTWLVYTLNDTNKKMSQRIDLLQQRVGKLETKIQTEKLRLDFVEEHDRLGADMTVNLACVTLPFLDENMQRACNGRTYGKYHAAPSMK